MKIQVFDKDTGDEMNLMCAWDILLKPCKGCERASDCPKPCDKAKSHAEDNGLRITITES